LVPTDVARNSTEKPKLFRVFRTLENEIIFKRLFFLRLASIKKMRFFVFQNLKTAIFDQNYTEKPKNRAQNQNFGFFDLFFW